MGALPWKRGVTMNSAVVLGLVISWAFLHAFYSVIESQWPASYYSIQRDLDRRISSSPLSYLVFRFGPVYLTTVFLAVTLDRLDTPTVLPSLLLGVLHIGSTSGLAILSMIRRKKVRDRPLVFAFYLLVSLMVIVATLVGSITAPWFESLVPPIAELSSSLWTALFAGVAGAFLIRVSRSSDYDPYDALESSRRSISKEVWETAEQAAQQVRGEPRLVQAFLLVENLQRPGWIRRAERAAGRLAGRGTYGPLQVASPAAQPDLVALHDAINRRFAGQRAPVVPSRWGGPTPDREWIRLFALAHNPSGEFAENVVMAYNWLDSPRTSRALVATDHQALDNLPSIEVHEIQRDESTIRISGTAVAYEAILAVMQIDAEGETLSSGFLTASLGAPARGTFRAEIAIVRNAATIELVDQAVIEVSPLDEVGRAERTIRIPTAQDAPIDGE